MSEENYQPPSADITPNMGDSDEEQDLRAFIGPSSTQYYIDRFRRIDEGRGGGWHWPAFFITSGWLLYRKMWLVAALYIIVLPLALATLVGVLAAAIDPGIGGVVYIAYYLAIFFVVPLFANKVYYGRVKAKLEKINAVGLEEQRRQRFIEKSGGTSLVAAILLLIIPFTGILAAIAIPAYQDYTIRAQVSEGLSLAAPAKAAVTEYYMTNGSLPSSNADLGMADTFRVGGQYVAAIDINVAEIEITYGNNANMSLTGSTLSLVPEARADGSLAWVCSSGDIDDKWLPAACRN